jgi:hypothetical protein
MKLLITALATFLSVQSWAAKPVCVLNDVNFMFNPCEKFPMNSTYLVPINESIGQVCTSMMNNEFCEKEDPYYQNNYAKVVAVDGRTICVMNYNQFPKQNPCKSDPNSGRYAYVKSAE